MLFFELIFQGMCQLRIRGINSWISKWHRLILRQRIFL